ncbi:MAG: dipeptidyl-peptidase IV [Candidatus Parvibacillus calidus]|nr:MAG: dipeptidyl-peptidase IV [Candidatus Parvibacillus calidus]
MQVKKLFILFLAISSSALLIAQGQKSFDLNDVFRKGTFRTKSLPGFAYMKDGKSYIINKGDALEINHVLDGKSLGTYISSEQWIALVGDNSAGIESYQFSEDESKVLIVTGSEQIFRHSSKGKTFVFDKKKGSGVVVFDGKPVSNPTFSPDGMKVGFTCENNLYYMDLTTNTSTQVTNDGKWNFIINGMCDWVYEEEFSFTRAFEWSSDSRKIGFLRFDESKVPEYSMEYYRDEMYPIPFSFKYPKVGEDNSTLEVKIYNLDTRNTVTIDQIPDKEIYYPRIKWTRDPNKLCVFKMNRHQNNLELLLADASSGKTTILMKEDNKYYIEINDYLTFLKDGKHFIWVTDKGGFYQAFLHDMNGNRINAITQANYDLSNIYGYDENTKTLYYQLIAPTPMQREVYKVGLDGKKPVKLSIKDGNNAAQFSPTFEYMTLIYSNINTPTSWTLYDKKNKIVRVLEDNQAAIDKFKEFKAGKAEFFSFTTSEGVQLNGYQIKPSNFDPNKKYPVFMYLYGGPGSQQVVDRWGGGQSWWFKMIAESGYIVACVDNRGTGGRGEEFRKMTYMQLGHYEVIDQIEAAKYLGSLPYVDAGRIGIFGWSYGGYMSSLCLLKGNDVFKAALAVAPVTNWKWYDSIYTERYMRTYKENPDGFKDNSPIYFADRLKGNYFLAHGIADDNVHFQNSVEMNRALIKAGKQFEFHMYPNSNHGIYSEGATMHLYNAMTKFIMDKI